MAMFLYNPQSRFCSPIERIMDEVMSDLTNPMSICPYWKDMSLGQECNVGKAVGKVVNDKERFSVEVDVSQFKPEELKVNINDGQLTLEGHHEEKDVKSGSIERHFIRKFVLPDDINNDTIQSRLSDKGILSVSANKIAICGNTSRTIPILPGKASKQTIANGNAE